MMKQHYRLFNVGPQKSSLGFISAETENTLKEFCERVRLQIGESKGITVFPHRILQNHWGVELIGNIQSVHLLLNITGRFSLPAIDNKVWPARLVIDMADHVDAYWFTISRLLRDLIYCIYFKEDAMTFTVDSHLEYFLTLLAWIINNNIFAVLVQTGLFVLPLIFVLIGTWMEVKKQGEDEGNKGDLLITWLGLKFYPAMFVVVLTLAPMFPIHLNNIELNVERSKACGYRVPTAPKDSGYNQMSSELGDQQAKVPLWWGLFHQINKGVTHALISSIPCKPDLRQVRFEVQHEKINNPALLTEVRQFVQQCYVPARQKIQSSQLQLTPAQVRETSWLGGRILISNSELYPRYRAQQPHSLFPYNASRDNGLPNNGEGGFPNCAEWWDTANNGLKDRLLADVKQNFSAKVIDFFSSKDNSDESILRTVLRAENMDISRGKVYPGYGGELDPTFANAVTRLTSSAGTFAASFAAFPAFDAMRQALPMVHAFMLMAVIIITPLVIVMSGYSLKTLVTLTFVSFALVSLTFWWELARWLDSWLLSALYDSSIHSRINPYFLENTQDDFIVNFVMGSMFLVLPAIWLGSMSWAGVKMGDIANSLAKGSQDSKGAGSTGGELLSKGGRQISSGFNSK